MKHPIKSTLVAAGFLSLAMPAMADTIMISGELDGSEPVFDNPETGATTLTGYDTYEITVNATGMYDIHSFYAGDVGTDANLDGYILLYSGSFDPANPGAAVGFDDDYLAGDIPGLADFDAACEGPNCSGFSAELTAGTNYVLVQTSFTDAPTSFGQATGDYELTITGPGDITVVPVPAAAWLMLSGLAGLGFMRRKAATA